MAAGSVALQMYNVNTRAGMVFGAQVFVDEFFRAIAEHGTLPYQLFAQPHEHKQAVEKMHELGARVGGSSSPIRPSSALATAFAREPVIAFHDVQLHAGRSFPARKALAARPFPITLLHHTVSYRRYLHQDYLRLLLEDTRPYDSLVCSTDAARKALVELMEHVVERMAADHGARLSYRGRMDTIPLGVDLEVWKPRDRLAARAQMMLPRDAFVFLWLGRLSPLDKGDLIPMVDAFARLIEETQRRDLLLVIAGTGRPGDEGRILAHAVRRRVLPYVRMMISPRAANLLMNAADVFLFPVDSVQESFGIAAIEAMAAGVPQIASEWDGCRDTIVDGVTGFLVPTRWADCADDIAAESMITEWELVDHLALAQSVVIDPEILVHRMRTLLEQPQLRAAMAEASRRRALERYGWPTVIAKYEALWQELAATAARDERGPSRAPSYSTPPFWRAFRHYATHELRAEDVIAITAAGRAIAERGDALGPPPRVIDTQLVEAVLRELVGGALTLHEIEHRLGVAHAITDVRRHVLWTLKYALAVVQ